MTLPAPFTFPRFNGDALCAEVDPELFFPDKGGSAKAAKNVCARCDVRDQCLAWALEHTEAGVWGMTSDTERRDMKKKIRRTGRFPKPIEHGTERGAAQHKRRGEDPCTHCATAATAAWTARQKRDECPVCGDWMLKSSVPRHMERRHPQAQEDVA